MGSLQSPPVLPSLSQSASLIPLPSSYVWGEGRGSPGTVSSPVMLREEAKHSRGRGCPGTASLGDSPTLGPQDQTGEAGVGASRRRQWAEAGGHCGAAGARTGDAGVREGLGRRGQPACQARASDGLSVGAVVSGGVTGLLSARAWVPPLPQVRATHQRQQMPDLPAPETWGAS